MEGVCPFQLYIVFGKILELIGFYFWLPTGQKVGKNFDFKSVKWFSGTRGKMFLYSYHTNLSIAWLALHTLKNIWISS